MAQIFKDKNGHSIGFFDCECGTGGMMVAVSNNYKKGTTKATISIIHEDDEDEVAVTIGPSELSGLMFQLGGALWGHRN
jgi:hypothetical protein